MQPPQHAALRGGGGGRRGLRFEPALDPGGGASWSWCAAKMRSSTCTTSNMLLTIATRMIARSDPIPAAHCHARMSRSQRPQPLPGRPLYLVRGQALACDHHPASTTGFPFQQHTPWEAWEPCHAAASNMRRVTSRAACCCSAWPCWQAYRGRVQLPCPALVVAGTSTSATAGTSPTQLTAAGASSRGRNACQAGAGAVTRPGMRCGQYWQYLYTASHRQPRSRQLLHRRRRLWCSHRRRQPARPWARMARHQHLRALESRRQARVHILFCICGA